LKAIQGITQQIAQLPSHYLKIGKFSQSPLYKALKKIFQDYGKNFIFSSSIYIPAYKAKRLEGHTKLTFSM